MQPWQLGMDTNTDDAREQPHLRVPLTQDPQSIALFFLLVAVTVVSKP